MYKPNCVQHLGYSKKGYFYEALRVYKGPVFVQYWANDEGTIKVSDFDVGGGAFSWFKTSNGTNPIEAHNAAETFERVAGISLDDARKIARVELDD